MTGGIGPRAFQDLRQVQDSQARYVTDNTGGFRPAAQGSFLGKAINWLKEIFRPAHVREQNVAAYTAAKNAFLAGGGNATLAARVFDPGIATGTRFSPSKISEALLTKFSDSDVADIYKETRMDARAEKAGTGLELVDIEGGFGRKVAKQFLPDVDRCDIIIDNKKIEKDGDRFNTGTNFYLAMGEIGADHQEIAEISKYVNQRTIINFVMRLQDPQLTSLSIDDGTIVSPLFLPSGAEQADNKLQTFAITKNGDNFEVKFVSREPLSVLNTVVDVKGQKAFGEPIPLDPQSNLVISASMTIGPDDRGFMSLLSIDDASYKLSAFSEDGSRLA